MNLDLVDVSISVAGTSVIFSQMTLHQKMNSHAFCEILVDYDAFGDKSWMSDPVKIINFIGESLSITMTHKVSGATCVFNGLVSNISFTGYHGANNHILIRGTSETVKLNGKPHIDSFVNKTLEEIVNEAVGTSGNGAAITVKPEYTKPIDYQMQYNETCFDFLNRLSYLYGESFYSKDGSEVFFGKIEPEDSIDITYDLEMTEFNLDANLCPPVFGHYNYLNYYHEEWLKETRKPIPEASGYLQPALDKSEMIYTSKVNTSAGALVHDSDSLLKMVDIERTRSVADMLILSGKTQTCKVGLGRVVTVGFPANLKIDTSPGAFIVTEVTHTVNKEGHYSNEFKGVRATLGYIPVYNVKMPVTAPQRATVLSNDDPERKGRIQVQMQFQKYSGKETNWIRVLSPDAGGTGHVAKNRGYVFIPEQGDDVMIQFEDNDPARPYCAGSLFPETIGKGGGADNHLKTIKTRSGHTIALDDADDTLSITIVDRKNNLIYIDSANNDITVTANRHVTINATETMTLNCKNMNVNVSENMVTKIGNDQQTTIGNNQQTTVAQDIAISATNVNEVYSEDSISNVGCKKTTTVGESDYFTTNGDMVIKSVGKALVQGAVDAKVSRG
ncbi:MAG TPA: hypothetical protein DIT04_09510 [Dysgonomonas sp.]|nr:hypothetical protein [Dysgonomonas sp.]